MGSKWTILAVRAHEFIEIGASTPILRLRKQDLSKPLLNCSRSSYNVLKKFRTLTNLCALRSNYCTSALFEFLNFHDALATTWCYPSFCLKNQLIAFSTSRLRILFAQTIMSSSVNTSSSKAYSIMFFDTMRPTSVFLSRNGRSHSSQRSKSMGMPEG